MARKWYPLAEMLRLRFGRGASARRRGLTLERLEVRSLPTGSAWASFGHDPQHSGLSDVPAQSPETVPWLSVMDYTYSSYSPEGSPVVTDANTVIVPVRTSQNSTLQSSYRVEARTGQDGFLLWTQPTDYIGPFLTALAPVLTPTNRLYYAGAGGTVYYCDDPDDPGATATGQLAFYGIGNYNHQLDSEVFITTPLTADAQGAIYFGFEVTGANALGLQSGIARLNPDGTGTWIAAADAAGDPTITAPATNSAPALSADGQTLYVAVQDVNDHGYLVALDAATLAPLARVRLQDVQSGSDAVISGSASPTVGPDGDVYFGLFAAATNPGRGWMLHFSADLSTVKLPGAYGADDTASVIPRRLVPSYTGPSDYLILTNYNHPNQYFQQVAVLDPNTPMVDPDTGATVMSTVLTVDSPRNGEWDNNDVAVDPATDAAFITFRIPPETTLYRWDLASNTLSQGLPLTLGYGNTAGTPTLIGADGTVYAIQFGGLFAARAVSPGAPSPRLVGDLLLAAGLSPGAAGFPGPVSTAGSLDVWLAPVAVHPNAAAEALAPTVTGEPSPAPFLGVSSDGPPCGFGDQPDFLTVWTLTPFLAGQE